MASGGGDFPSWARTKARGPRRRRQAASLPLDVIVDIAARSDPVTLVRCAAACRDLRRHVADPGFRHRLRLRHADRFVPSLLRGHLIGDLCYLFRSEADKDEPIYLVEATAAGATVGALGAGKSFPRGPDGKPLTLSRPLSARDGLVLVHNHKAHELRVFNLATGRSQAVPHGPCFTGGHVLLVGDGEGGDVGRPFRVVKANLLLDGIPSRLLAQTFSSELGMWGACTEIQTSHIHGNSSSDPLSGGPLVVGGAVHWLCRTSSAGYVLKLHDVRAAAAPRLTVTRLPNSYPYNSGGRMHHLLATIMEAGRRRPAVLVADGDKISAWTQSTRFKWNEQPQLVIQLQDAISRLLGSVGDERLLKPTPSWMSPREHVILEWFAERSGIVLIRRMRDKYYFWLDLQSMEIVRWSRDPRIGYTAMYCPCEMDLTTWVPTFSSSL